MVLAIELLSFLIFFSVVVRNVEGQGGQCVPMSEDEIKADKDASEGSRLVLAYLKNKGVSCKPGHELKVQPDLQICKQVVYGWNYIYTWGRTLYECVDNVTNQHNTAKEENLSCEASYWVDPYGDAHQFSDPKCTPQG